MSKLYCSNLHYNENANRLQSKTTEGTSRWSISYPKAHKGEKAVAKPIKELPTYSKHIFGALNNAAKYTRLGFVLVKLVWSAWHCFRWNYLEVLQIN